MIEGIALFVFGACLVAFALLVRRGKRLPPGAPVEPVVEDDTTPIDMPMGMMNPCPHGIAVSEPCPKCNGAMRGKHVTLEDDDQPRVPPPPPVGPKGAA